MNKEILCGGRSYGKVFFQNRIKQAYEAGKKVEFREKENLIKYLEDKIKFFEDKINKLNIPNVYIHFDIAEMYRDKIKIYQDILERVKSGKYDE